MMYAVAIVAILITILLALVRALLGPTVFDRIVAMNMLGTKTISLYCFPLVQHPPCFESASLEKSHPRRLDQEIFHG